MQRVIHQSIMITLEVVSSGVTKCTAERATAAIVSEWLRFVGQRIVTQLSMPVYQIYVRQSPLSRGEWQGAQIQILLCWIVLQAHRQEINDFERL